MLFVIYSPGVHTQVFLAHTTNQEQAWKLYLEHVWNYREQPDGTYRGKSEIHQDRQEALETYGLVRQSDSSYSNKDEHFASFQEAQIAYGIEEDGDKITSHGKSHSSLTAALHGVPWQAHRLEIAPAFIRSDSSFQELFTSKDEWDYIGLAPEEDVRADLIATHHWQASRYERLRLLPDAVAELKKGLRLAITPRDKAKLHQELARLLLFEMDEPSAAAVQYERALRLGVTSSNSSLIRYRLAKIYLQLGQRARALRQYRRIVLDDLDDEEISEVEEQIDFLSTVT